MADYSFEDAPDFDILLIPGGFGTRAAVSNDALLAKIAAMSAKADVTATVCTGSAVLARTGLLDGRPATSNKVAWDWVLEQGPKVDWKRQARWVDDGDIVTSSGVSAGYRHGPRPDCPAAGRRDRREFGEIHGIYLNRAPANDPFAKMTRLTRSDLIGKAQTVRGLIDPEDLGPTLMHEHLLWDIRTPKMQANPDQGPEIDLCNCWHINYGSRGKVPRNLVLFDRKIATQEIAEMRGRRKPLSSLPSAA